AAVAAAAARRRRRGAVVRVLAAAAAVAMAIAVAAAAASPQEPPVVRLLGPECRTLTVGDGDLAFSAALADSWGHARARGLVATVYDLDTEVAKKYAAAPGRISRLREAGAE
ncbi:unnamed protein product, partial [Prorocentrum cordatum]